jgi:hypothetical protein
MLVLVAPEARHVMLKRKLSMPTQWEAQGLVEYGMILVLVAVVCIAGLIVLSGTINGFFQGVVITP